VLMPALGDDTQGSDVVLVGAEVAVQSLEAQLCAECSDGIFILLRAGAA
jgi:hypothetical protein